MEMKKVENIKAKTVDLKNRKTRVSICKKKMKMSDKKVDMKK